MEIHKGAGVDDITKGWSRPKMHRALLEMIPYLTNPDLLRMSELCTEAVEDREEKVEKSKSE